MKYFIFLPFKRVNKINPIYLKELQLQLRSLNLFQVDKIRWIRHFNQGYRTMSKLAHMPFTTTLFPFQINEIKMARCHERKNLREGTD